MLSPEDQIKMSQFRQKAVAGSLSIDDMVEVVKILREGRRSAASATAGAAVKKAATKAVASVSGDDLLDQMMG